jgi:aminoglycoside 3-N-acetyltransferase
VTAQDALYALARRVLDQETRDRLNAGLARGKKRLAPVLRRLHGSFDVADLGREIARALPARFDALMVHCSFDDLLPMYTQGVGPLLEALRAFCGPERTLAMPAFTFHLPGGDLARHFAEHPRFDLRRQPSQMGLLSEIFRRTAGVRRSLHPTHSTCALGPRAEWIVSGHHLAPTTFGAGSPFARMAEIDTVILGIGKPFYRVLTQTHVPEDLLGDRFPVPRTFREVDVVLVDGRGEVPYRFRIDTTAIERRVHRLRRLLEPGDLTEWRFHGVPLFWTRAERITTRMCEAALRGRTIYSGPTLA